MTAVRKPEWMTPDATGYWAECDRCGWRKHYAAKASARSGLSGHRCKPRVWARCPSCRGICHFHDTDWVCSACGDEWPEASLEARGPR
jgi:hypothetical protein